MIVLGFKGKSAKIIYPPDNICTYYVDFGQDISEHISTCCKIEYILSFNNMSLKDSEKFPGCIENYGVFPEFDSEEHLINFINYLNKNCLIRVSKNIL